MNFFYLLVLVIIISLITLITENVICHLHNFHLRKFDWDFYHQNRAFELNYFNLNQVLKSLFKNGPQFLLFY